MADQNIKDFTINWIVFGFLFLSLVVFAMTFMANNNPTGLGSSQRYFDDTNATLTSRLIELPAEGDELLNITSKTNPEVSFLGSRDSIATGYKLIGSGRGFFESSKIFIAWIFTDDEGNNEVGGMLLVVFGGLFSMVALYWIFKWIRTGT